MYLNEQEYFILLSQESNFTRAAEKACISQPAMSKAISKLEKDYGIRLVHRDGKNVTLTPAGEIYLSAAKKMLQIRDDAYSQLRALHQKQVHRLRIGVNRQYTQQRFRDIFRNYYTNSDEVFPDVYEMDSNEAISMLRKGLLDIAIALRVEGTEEDDFISYPLTSEYLAALIPESEEFSDIISQYPRGTVLPVRTFHQRSTIRIRGGSNLDRLLQSFLTEHGVVPDYVCDICDVDTAIVAVQNGFGLIYNYVSRAELFQIRHYYRVSPSLPLRHYVFLRPEIAENPQVRLLVKALQHFEAL